MSARAGSVPGADGLSDEQRAVLLGLFAASGEGAPRFVRCSGVLASALGVARVPSLDDLLLARRGDGLDAPGGAVPDDDAARLRAQAYHHYLALVRLAQPFFTVLPLVEGSGHFGSSDGEPPADHPYTECRLTPDAEALLDLERQSARLPMILVMGSGPPFVFPAFEAQAVARACWKLARRADAPIDLGPPRVPSGRAALADPRSLVYTGRGTLVCSALLEPGVAPYSVRVAEPPWLVARADVVRELAAERQAGRWPEIVDIREGFGEADRSALVLDLTPGADVATFADRLRARLTVAREVALHGVAKGACEPLSIRAAIGRFLEHRAALLGGREALMADLEHLVEAER